MEYGIPVVEEQVAYKVAAAEGDGQEGAHDGKQAEDLRQKDEEVRVHCSRTLNTPNSQPHHHNLGFRV